LAFANCNCECNWGRAGEWSGWPDYDNSGMADASDANKINKHIKCDLQRSYEHRALVFVYENLISPKMI